MSRRARARRVSPTIARCRDRQPAGLSGLRYYPGAPGIPLTAIRPPGTTRGAGDALGQVDGREGRRASPLVPRDFERHRIRVVLGGGQAGFMERVEQRFGFLATMSYVFYAGLDVFSAKFLGGIRDQVSRKANEEGAEQPQGHRRQRRRRERPK